MTLELDPHLDETIERDTPRYLPARAVDRYRPAFHPTPAWLHASGPPFSTVFRDNTLGFWRFAGCRLVRTAGGLYAFDKDNKAHLLPVPHGVAEEHLRWPEAYAQPERVALLVSAWLGLLPLVDQDEARAVSHPALHLLTHAPPRLLEAWRAPSREDNEVVFFAGTAPEEKRNQIVRVRVDLANRWVELEELCAGWHHPPGHGETEDIVSINFAAEPEPPVVLNRLTDPRPRGVLNRLRRIFSRS